MITAEELAALYPARNRVRRRADRNVFELRHPGHPLGADYDIDPKTGCWIWRWHKIRGQPQICINRRAVLLNRYLLDITDLDPSEFKAVHRIDVCSGRMDCINPDHVYIGDHGDYMNEVKLRQYWKGYSIWR